MNLGMSTADTWLRFRSCSCDVFGEEVVFLCQCHSSSAPYLRHHTASNQKDKGANPGNVHKKTVLLSRLQRAVLFGSVLSTVSVTADSNILASFSGGHDIESLGSSTVMRCSVTFVGFPRVNSWIWDRDSMWCSCLLTVDCHLVIRRENLLRPRNILLFFSRFIYFAERLWWGTALLSRPRLLPMSSTNIVRYGSKTVRVVEILKILSFQGSWWCVPRICETAKYETAKRGHICIRAATYFAHRVHLFVSNSTVKS